MNIGPFISVMPGIIALDLEKDFLTAVLSLYENAGTDVDAFVDNFPKHVKDGSAEVALNDAYALINIIFKLVGNDKYQGPAMALIKSVMTIK